MITGTLSLTIQTEDDILLLARIIEEKRLAAKSENPEDKVERPQSTVNERRQRPSNAEVLDKLRSRFQSNEFSRAQAIDEVKKIAGYSSAKTGRILRSGLEVNKLHRIREGWYAFMSVAMVQPEVKATTIKHSSRRSISVKQRSRLRTLQNNMLYLNFKAKLERLNPDRDIEQLIDRDLEPQEALEDLKKKYPDLIMYEETERDIEEEFKEYLSSIGIENSKIQDLIVLKMEQDPFTNEELKTFARGIKQTQSIVQRNS